MTVLLRGIPMVVYEYEAISEAIRQAGDFYEAEILDDLADRLPIQRTIIDAGANIGNHSLYWSAFVPYERLYAFEPVPENAGLLFRNLAPYSRALCFEMALSDNPGYLRMTRDPVNMCRCSIDGDGDLQVATTTVDAIAKRENVSLLKIDTEGHEARVLAGARRVIERCHPAILVEDEFDIFGELLMDFGLDGYRQTMTWAGANHLWEWVS